MTYVMDEATYNNLRWTAENEMYKGTTRKTKGHGEGMLKVLDTLKENWIKDDIVIVKPGR